ncbi:phosphotransferase [Brevibacillus fulvus]|uniref:Ser/Thr protein kinase RdoA (MazF antagonist) n=1 Tax=Brevibacillus fulvus TaxID=1125967 RepID=A0A938XYM1_9BACL|nr:phosphotransferase [Brevibacillus fulvus]MBM7590038.1 Ser/Thr protein kinase RdoA (MazF antagonist) [Brevibacillus fulvus]
MNSVRVDLRSVLKNYKARVIQIKQVDDYYLLETNRGRKQLQIWPRVDLLKWSFEWRERLARAGIREVERFIRTRDAKPFVVAEKLGFVLVDHLEGAQPFQLSTALVQDTGQRIAHLHLILKETQQFFPVDLLAKEQLMAIAEAKRAADLQDELIAVQSNRGAAWLLEQFRPLRERMEKCVELLQQLELDPEGLIVSHRQLGIHNWCLVEGKPYLRGFNRTPISIQHRDVASFLRELYVQSGSMELVSAFLDGYETIRPLRYDEYKLIIALLVYPREVWEQLQKSAAVVISGAVADTWADDLQAVLERQCAWDQMIVQLAYRAERTRGVKTGEQI